jgi:hypothetical protein
MEACVRCFKERGSERLDVIAEEDRDAKRHRSRFYEWDFNAAQR